MRRVLVAFAGSLLLAPLAASQGWLDSARWYLLPPLDQFRALGDFNADGHDDLVVFSSVPEGSNSKLVSFRVAFNDGTGQFPTLGPVTSVPVNASLFRPLDLDGLRRMVDLTGDGHLDLLLLEEQASVADDIALHLYPGLGNGDFGAPASVALTGFLDAAAVGQADADPQLELAIVEQISNSEHTRWYDWSGGELNGSDEAFIFGGISSPTAARLVALDLDLDGDDDLVFGQQSGQNLRVMQTVAGAPVLGQLLTVGQNSGYSLWPHVVDLIGGGPQDLLVVEIVQGGSQFWFTPVLNQSGTLVQGPRQEFSGGAIFGNNLEPCDWDADGDTDMLAFGWQEPGGSTDALVAMFRNDGLDGFGTGPVAKADLRSTAANTTLGTADLDGDGHLDAIGPQCVQFGRSRFESTPTVVTDFFFGVEPIVSTDVEGDGDVDMLFASATAFTTTLAQRLNDGTGAHPGTTFLPALPPNKLTTGAVSAGDFTGDGLHDFLVTWQNPPTMPFTPPSFAEMRLVKDNGFGALVDGGTASLSMIQASGRRSCLAHDFDGDGDTDVWAGSGAGYWLNDGTGQFPGKHVVPGPSFLEANTIGDMDNDGDADIAALTGFEQIQMLVNGLPAEYVQVTVASAPFSVDVDSITLADHDADGDLDLSCATTSADSVHLFANDGSGAFTSTADLSTHVAAGVDPPLSVHAFMDVDGDGLTDLLAGPVIVSSGYPDKVALFRGTENGYEPARWYVGTAMGAAVDVDGDGDLDLAGRSIVKSRLFDGPSDGIIRQYGAGTVGAGGAVPLLGGAGPLRPGSATAAMKLRRAAGGVPMLLIYGFTEAAIPNSPFQGSTLYVQPPFNTLLLVTSGSGGAAGQGTLDLGLTPVLPIVAGITVFHQAALFEPGKKKVTSNGLQFTYGN